jgi:hypothetical protein
MPQPQLSRVATGDDGAAAGPWGQLPPINVYIGNEQVDAHIDRRIDRYDTNLRRALRAR